MSETTILDADLRLALRRATVAGARAAAALVGGGDPDALDAAAVDALRAELARAPMSGRIVAGEGEKDGAPMLHPGELLGSGGPEVDLAVDPVDGTRLAARAAAGAMVVIAAAARGAFAEIGPALYMDKFVASARVPGLSIEEPLARTLDRIARARGVAPGEVAVAIQDRPRNLELMRAARAFGARCDFFEHGDVERAINALHHDSPTDLVLGIGGAPEGLVVAAAARALGGHMQARLAPQSRAERARIEAQPSAPDMSRVLELDELCAGPAAIFVTALTALEIVPGSPMPGVSGAGLDEKIYSWSA